MNQSNEILESIKKLDGWITQNNFKDYDPFDGLNARYLALFTFNNHYLRIILQQSIRRFPINLRPLFGIKKETSGKGIGFCALGYLNLYLTTKDENYLKKMRFCLDWLSNNFSEGYSGYCWGNHFSYESRGGRIPIGVPTIVWTSLIANVFFDAYEVFNESMYFDIGKSSCEHILNDIDIYKDSKDVICFMYTPGNKQNLDGRMNSGYIHNSNVLGAWLLARLYQHTKDEKVFDLARKSINYTLKYQLSDGGWYYGESEKHHWVDSFHTGYNLEAIYGYIKATGEKKNEEKLKKGFRYFKSTFFKNDGTPKYYNHKTYPIDIQCASQGIQTLVNLREYDPSALELAMRVAQWTIKHMQDPKGYFYFRKYPFFSNKTPMFHWGQATMLSALGTFLKAINENDG